MAVELDPKGQAFIANISQRLGRPIPTTPPHREFVGPPDFWTSFNPSKEEMIKQFSDNLHTLTGRASLVPDYEQLNTQILSWLKELNAKSIICWDTPAMQAAGIAKACKDSGIKVVLWDPKRDRQEMIRDAANVDVGITWADYAISTTGTVALFSNPLQGRSVSLLPPVHLAVVNTDRLVARMGEVLRLVSSGERNASSLNFITGPSRTSDIEMDLSVGVHGPGKVFVALLDTPSVS
jgi:L-lactate dehydrogenase complex protein LldG